MVLRHVTKKTFEDEKSLLPNVVAEWLSLLLRIREAPGSNLGPEADYPD
jgi:hypothetical protein